MLGSVAEMLRASDDTCEEIARLAAAEAEEHQTEDHLRLEANRRRSSEVARQIENLTNAIAEGVDPKPLVERMNRLAEERAALEEEAEELERAGVGNMFEVALYVLEYIRDTASTPTMALPFVSRMVIGDDGSTHVEFRLKDRTPIDKTGVLIGHSWLGH